MRRFFWYQSLHPKRNAIRNPIPRLVPVALIWLLVLATPATSAQVGMATQTPRETVTIDPATVLQLWTGDLDQMLQRRIIRVLVVPNKTFYFNDKARNAE